MAGGLVLKIVENTTPVLVGSPQVTYLTIADFDVAADAILKSLGQAKGDMIAFSAASTPGRVPKGTNGQVPVYDDTVALGITPKTLDTGGGTAQMTNKSGGDLVLGAVVINDPDNDYSFKSTTIVQDRRIVGVLGEDIASNVTGKVLVGPQRAKVLVAGNVARGEFLVCSATAGRAQAAGFSRPPGAIAMALTEYTGGGNGDVQAILCIDFFLGSSKGSLYCFGSNAPSNLARKYAVATETWSNVAGANLTTARGHAATMSLEATKGFICGGYTGAASAVADRITFSTDTTSAVTGANLSSARGKVGGAGGSTHGYAGSGYTGAADTTTTDKLTYSTETTASNGSAAFGEAGAGRIGFSDGTAGYFGGRTNNTTAQAEMRKIPYATDTRANLGNNLTYSTGRGAGFTNTTQTGYVTGGRSGSVALASANKMPYSTETPASITSLSGNRQGHGGAHQNGIAGYAFGGGGDSGLSNDEWGSGTTPFSSTEKLPFSTETWTTAGIGALPAATPGTMGLASAV